MTKNMHKKPAFRFQPSPYPVKNLAIVSKMFKHLNRDYAIKTLIQRQSD